MFLRASLFWVVWLAVSLLATAAPGGDGSSLTFFVNDPFDSDYGQILDLPPTFGTGEFTLELWIRPDDSFPVGDTSCCAGQRLNWSDADVEPYSSGSWWFTGNFLLDGHNNVDFASGTFSLQFYGSGRVRWLFGDGASPTGGNWSVGAYPATGTASLLDGNWHHLTLVRRWEGASAARLELWVDGQAVAAEITPVRTDMQAAYWSDWSGFPTGQEGWFWGAEKQAAIGLLSQYEDYKGPIDELRFWDRAKSPGEIGTGWNLPVDGTEPGLVGWFRFNEGAGVVTCDELTPARCIDLFDMKPGYWSDDEPPLGGGEIFSDGFESGDVGAWSNSVP